MYSILEETSKDWKEGKGGGEVGEEGEKRKGGGRGKEGEGKQTKRQCMKKSRGKVLGR